MGFMLFSFKEDGVSELDYENAFQINFWNWYPIAALIRRLDIIRDEERLELLDCEGCGGTVTATEARAIAKALREHVIPSLATGEWLLRDGQRSTEILDPARWAEPDQTEKNLRTNGEVLAMFADYCEGSHGFVVA